MGNCRGIAAAVTLVLAGCSSQPLFRDSVKEFAKGAQSTADVLEEQSQGITKDERLRLANKILLGHDGASRNGRERAGQNGSIEAFATYACAGTGAFTDQRTASRLLNENAKVLEGYAADPSDKQDELIASIEKYSSNAPKLIAPPESFDPGKPAQNPAFDNCLAFVKGEFGNALAPAGERDLLLFLGTASAAFEAFQKLQAAAEKIAILFEQRADVAVREAKLKQLINDPASHDLMRRLLGSCIDDTDPVQCQDKGLDAESNAFSNGLLARTLTDRKVASLLLPYHEFRAVLAAPKRTAVDRAKFMEAAVVVHNNLVDFDGLRLKTAPKNITVPTIKAWQDLRRIAAGNLTNEEQIRRAYSALKTYAAMMKALLQDLKEVKAELKNTRDAFDKIPF